MAGKGIADLLEASPIDLRARGFRRVTRSRRAWDKRISDDIVWRISIDGDRMSAIYAGVVVPYFAACRPFAVHLSPFHEWWGVVSYNAAKPLGWLASIDVDRPRRRMHPSHRTLRNVDLVEALTELCRLLAIGLPKN